MFMIYSLQQIDYGYCVRQVPPAAGHLAAGPHPPAAGHLLPPGHPAMVEVSNVPPLLSYVHYLFCMQDFLGHCQLCTQYPASTVAMYAVIWSCFVCLSSKEPCARRILLCHATAVLSMPYVPLSMHLVSECDPAAGGGSGGGGPGNNGGNNGRRFGPGYVHYLCQSMNEGSLQF